MVRNLVAEVFILIAIIALAAIGIGYARKFIVQMVEEGSDFLEEKKLYKQLISKLKDKSEAELHALAVDLLLVDTRAALHWFEHKSILDERQKHIAIERLRATLAEHRGQALSILECKSPTEIRELIVAEATRRPVYWRQEYVMRL